MAKNSKHHLLSSPVTLITVDIFLSIDTIIAYNVTEKCWLILTYWQLYVGFDCIGAILIFAVICQFRPRNVQLSGGLDKHGSRLNSD